MKYTVLRADRAGQPVKVGDTVYPAAAHDYGMSADDTRDTGVEHISVTLDAAGGYPFFTMPHEDLSLVMTEPLKDIDNDHARDVCKVGQGAACCRYLAMGPGGWSCEKTNPGVRMLLDDRVRSNTMISHGDNCEGRRSR